MQLTWKNIAPVPTSQEFLDIVLSRTQRRLPTQIRAGFKISRIRAFYTRKVKFTAETFNEKLSAILETFPRLQDIHPFHSALMNTLYDADHFRIALGQLSTAKHLVEQVARDYVRLIKYAQSLFQCKQLKRAGLGRMATITKRLKGSLEYLEQVRQHLGRLPSIDPNTRTLLICGYPNVGKSSFLKSVTRADVDVQPYAFTTKSLYVGHFDYKYLRFQAIDTPGILDHPLEEMNTIEMQSITAIAHLRSAVMYFVDLSEQCGYSVEAQVKLFHSIKPLFANKIVFLVVNKIDAMRPEDLDDEKKAMLETITKSGEVEMLKLSCHTEEGVMDVRNTACDRLLAVRVEQKLKNAMGSAASKEAVNILNRIHVSRPMSGAEPKPYIPDAVLNKPKYDVNDPNRPRLLRDIEAENGGAGVFNVNLKDFYLLENDDWKNDIIPEMFNGKNVADFIDPEIEAKLAALEEEEEQLEASGFYQEEEDIEDEEEVDIREKAEYIREQQQLIRNAARSKKALKNRAIMPRSTAPPKKLSEMEAHLDKLGLDSTKISERARSKSRGRSRRDEGDVDMMDVDGTPGARSLSVHQQNKQKAIEKAKIRARSKNRLEAGMPKSADGNRSQAEKMQKLNQKRMNRMARQGEADRHQSASIAKHLVAGKRDMGTHRSR
ncbi:P-loop containing nucleoside triphosphate hydrolase protein [Pyronema domesticum]|uniref:Nucleolar GTP-binding protein 1 n=1 Tax=Pyronema omphalodes (strain CBS 100304) TaxID=1076935 RepID=U4LJP3_PYROM|nr:P-loop containing nucleoside triphosphate hydrolase protein [Pyronema domesticum]CCX29600.1 Similar to Nucleolar GTP-binding protein 1; acc. no. Q74ZK6 [Pyronema omphalodes CBS 100304]